MNGDVYFIVIVNQCKKLPCFFRCIDIVCVCVWGGGGGGGGQKVSEKEKL